MSDFDAIIRNLEAISEELDRMSCAVDDAVQALADAKKYHGIR